MIVDPQSAHAEITPIGHKNISQTLMPIIVPDPNDACRVYCDCPGFLDNRGAEINIANSLNINHILRNAASVKAVFLTDYSFLSDCRGDIVPDLANMCNQMFGGVENLRRHQKRSTPRHHQGTHL